MGKALCCLLLLAMVSRNHAIVVDVKARGAKADGKTDDGPVLEKAWKEACAGAAPSSVLIPAGTYLASPPIEFLGPCKGPVEIKATGATIKAPPELAKFKNDRWIGFQNIDRLTITGGTFDGQGHETWKNNKCHDTAMTCPIPVSLRFSFVKNSFLNGVTSLNSKFFHLSLYGCDNMKVDHLTVTAPGGSTNTDGIHIGHLTGLNITNSNIKTGDDCISIGDGSKSVYIEKVTCGPGHGISIGSLGKYKNELPVQGIFVKNCTITGTTNGVRIKTWPGPTSTPGTASDIHFEDIIMNNVENPILIDQQYCPSNSCNKNTPSKVKISNVSFRRIKGTSATKVALKMACSPGIPCDNIEVCDINLTYNGAKGGPGAVSECSNVKPKVVGKNVPPACPAGGKPYDIAA